MWSYKYHLFPDNVPTPSSHPFIFSAVRKIFLPVLPLNLMSILQQQNNPLLPPLRLTQIPNPPRQLNRPPQQSQDNLPQSLPLQLETLKLYFLQFPSEMTRSLRLVLICNSFIDVSVLFCEIIHRTLAYNNYCSCI